MNENYNKIRIKFYKYNKKNKTKIKRNKKKIKKKIRENIKILTKINKKLKKIVDLLLISLKTELRDLELPTNIIKSLNRFKRKNTKYKESIKHIFFTSFCLFLFFSQYNAK